ncbi:MAG: hypothetical protein MUE44_29820 [Oscillatoriaceae cyanobacterium Prado104]|jgi:hypothetical protein|nr:hypothetical protein [Oscillatoriaceae cyanobacterium Prado104]
MNDEIFSNRRKPGTYCSPSLQLQDLETCMELSESEQELIKGGQILTSPHRTFWGVRTTGGLWTFWWDRATRKFGFSYQFT